MAQPQIVRPSDLMDWLEIDQTKASMECVAGIPSPHPEWYGWYMDANGVFRAHRKPTLEEVENNEFK